MIAIIDYEAGNLTSVARAVSHLGFKSTITNDAQTILDAERIIFPGVGHAGSAMEGIRRLGMDKALKTAFDQGKPIMGICLGTQIIMSRSEESDTECLGIVPGIVPEFPRNLSDKQGNALKIPHMGWNSISITSPHPVFEGLSPEDEFYFVHSYYTQPENPEHALATTTYGLTFVSAVGYKNIVATQFHPEKSGEAGLKILENFCRWQPC